MTTDARGAEINPGDIAIYVSAGRYTERIVVRVERTTDTRVWIDRLDPLDSRKPFEDTEKPSRDYRNESRWVNASSCFVVERLPFVEDRLNTGMPKLEKTLAAPFNVFGA